MATNANPLGIFSTALATMPKPFNLSKELSDYQLAQSQSQEMQSRAGLNQQATQGQQLENQKTQRELAARDAWNQAMRNNTQNVPLGPPSSQLPPPPLDPSGKPAPTPDYQQAQAASALQAPLVNYQGAIREMNQRGFGDYAQVMLKSLDAHQEALDAHEKSQQEQFQSKRTNVHQALSGVLANPDDAAAAQAWEDAKPVLAQNGAPARILNQPFNRAAVEGLDKGLIGIEGVAKQQEAKLGIEKTKSEIEAQSAETGERKANTKLIEENTLIAQNRRKALETLMNNPEALYGEIKTIWADNPSRAFAANGEAQFIARRGNPEEMDKFLTAQRTSADAVRTNITEKTNPELLNAEIKKSVAVATATLPIELAKAKALREGDNPALAGVPPAAAQGAVTQASKLDQDYIKAREATEAMGKLLDLADKGNVAAGANIPMVGVAAANAINGIKRINSAEIAQYGTAGSLLQKVQGKLEGWKDGQPIPASVRDDIREMQQQLGEGAWRQYTSGLDSINKRTGAKFGPTQEAPNIRKPAVSTSVQMKAPDGTVKAVPADQVAHYKQLGATLVQ